MQEVTAFLTTRVREPDKDDYKKLGRVIRCLRATPKLALTLEADNAHIIKWWIDAAFAIHPDMKSQTGATVSGPVVRPTDETRARCFTNGYPRIRHDLRRCNGIEMISSRSLNKSSLFRYFILYVV